MKSNLVSYFNDEKAFYEFSLLEVSGETRMKLLGITKAHYINSTIRDKWYNSIKKSIQNKNAIDKLEEIYNNMK